MRHSASADRSARFIVKKQEAKVRTFRFIRSNFFFLPVIRAHASKNLFFMYPKSKIHNYCVLTSRSRGILHEFKVSRMTLKALAGRLLLKGVKRSSW